MATRPPAGAPARRPAGTLGKLFSGKKTWWLVGGGAAVIVVIIALVKKSSAASAAGSTSTTADSTSDLPTYDSSLYDIESEFESQMQGLQNQLEQLTQNQTGTTSSTGTTGTGAQTGGSPPPANTTTTAPAPPAPPAAPSTQTIQIVDGETLSGIASEYGESLSQLLAMNPVYTTNPKYQGGNMIWAGDSVVVP